MDMTTQRVGDSIGGKGGLGAISGCQRMAAWFLSLSIEERERWFAEKSCFCFLAAQWNGRITPSVCIHLPSFIFISTKEKASVWRVSFPCLGNFSKDYNGPPGTIYYLAPIWTFVWGLMNWISRNHHPPTPTHTPWSSHLHPHHHHYHYLCQAWWWASFLLLFVILSPIAFNSNILNWLALAH